VLLFLGGWLPPFGFLDFIPGWIWLAIKVFVVVTMFLWVRATFPRFRYDQIMRLGWKIFIPVTWSGSWSWACGSSRRSTSGSEQHDPQARCAPAPRGGADLPWDGPAEGLA